MWKKIPRVLLIVVLVALVGGYDVLFGCCADHDPELSIPLQSVTLPDQDCNLAASVLKGPKSIPEEVRGISRYLPKTKTGIFNAVLFGVVLVLGIGLFAKVTSTIVKKGDIVERAEKLGESLQHQSEHRKDKIDFVQSLLCKPLPGSTGRPPFDISASTSFTTITEGNSTEGVTIIIDNITTEDYPIASYGQNGIITTEPMETTLITIGSPNEEECKRIGINIYYILYPFAPNSFEDIVGEYHVGTFFDTIKANITEASDYHCGSGFFEKVRMANHDGIYFNGENSIVRDAINDATCQRAAVAIFPLLEKLDQDINAENYSYTYDGTALVYTNLREAINIAYKKSCGDGFLTFMADGNKQTLTYSAVNTHIAKALVRYTTEKTCRNVAYEVVLCIQSFGPISKSKYASKLIWDGYDFKDIINAQAEIIDQNDCGSGFFSITRRNDNDGSYVDWNSQNPYIEEAVKKAEESGNCMKAAMETVKHLKWIGAYTSIDNNKVYIPNILDDVRLLIQKTRIAGSLDCGKNFFKVSKNDNDEYEIRYNKENPYVNRVMASVTLEDQCHLIANGVFRRLIDSGKYTTGISNSVVVDSPLELVEDIKRKINRRGRINCKTGFFTYSKRDHGITVNYHTSGHYLNGKETNIREEIWCPKGAYFYSYILNCKGYRMGDNSISVSFTLNDKEKELVNTATYQLSGVNCGSNFYSCELIDDIATCSWDSGNTHIQKALADVSASFTPLY